MRNQHLAELALVLLLTFLGAQASAEIDDFADDDQTVDATVTAPVETTSATPLASAPTRDLSELPVALPPEFSAIETGETSDSADQAAIPGVDDYGTGMESDSTQQDILDAVGNIEPEPEATDAMRMPASEEPQLSGTPEPEMETPFPEITKPSKKNKKIAKDKSKKKKKSKVAKSKSKKKKMSKIAKKSKKKKKDSRLASNKKSRRSRVR